MSAIDEKPQLELKPYAVPLPIAQKLLGGKGKGRIYEAIGRGELEAIKDGKRTLIILASIERRQKSLPPADFKKYPPLQKRGRKSRTVTA